MAAVSAGYTSTAVTNNTTTYSNVGVSFSRTIGSSGSAIVTLSAESLTSTGFNCVISFSGAANTGNSTAVDAFTMLTPRVATAVPVTQVFYISNFTAGANVTFTMQFKSGTAGSNCKLNEASMVVMSP